MKPVCPCLHPRFARCRKGVWWPFEQSKRQGWFVSGRCARIPPAALARRSVHEIPLSALLRNARRRCCNGGSQWPTSRCHQGTTPQARRVWVPAAAVPPATALQLDPEAVDSRLARTHGKRTGLVNTKEAWCPSVKAALAAWNPLRLALFSDYPTQTPCACMVQLKQIRLDSTVHLAPANRAGMA